MIPNLRDTYFAAGFTVALVTSAGLATTSVPKNIYDFASSIVSPFFGHKELILDGNLLGINNRSFSIAEAGTTQAPSIEIAGP